MFFPQNLADQTDCSIELSEYTKKRTLSPSEQFNKWIGTHYLLELVTNLYKFLPGGAALQSAKSIGQKMNLIAETPITPRCGLQPYLLRKD